MPDPIKVEDFSKLAPLVKAYELKPDMAYLFVCGPKNFSYDLAHALLKDVRENHPSINIFIIATAKPKGIEVREKDGLRADASSSSEVSGQDSTDAPET